MLATGTRKKVHVAHRWEKIKKLALITKRIRQNGLISRIFKVFWSGFLHRTTVYDL